MLILKGPVPPFTNLSNPELTTLLSTIREKAIMPTHLNPQQRALIYQEKYRKDLLIDPVVVNLNGEEFTLQPIDRGQDVPALKAGLFKALSLMETPEDFDNVPNLLKGLKQSGLTINTTLVRKVINRLTKAGRQNVVLQCARRGEETGFNLKNAEIVRQILWSFQRKADDADFEAGQTQKALKWSEHLFELLELPQYCGKGIPQGLVDPRTHPLTVGVLLELAAVRAERHLGGKDVGGHVEQYAKRLLATGVDLRAPKEEKAIPLWLGSVVPVVFGIKTALKVLDPRSATAEALRPLYERLEKDLAQQRSQHGGNPSSSLGGQTYDKLLGSSQ